jgi:hypothetical protein
MQFDQLKRREFITVLARSQGQMQVAAFREHLQKLGWTEGSRAAATKQIIPTDLARGKSSVSLGLRRDLGGVRCLVISSHRS